MSWKTINAILGLATVDEEFCRALLADPLAAVQARQFELIAEEQEAFKIISATSLSEFSQQLVALRDKQLGSSGPSEGE
ncbi:MAG: Os1348 family NHLP clan protein [Ktedonobacteraceae bacterium]